jgi:DNA polymerase-3 subunit alpha
MQSVEQARGKTPFADVSEFAARVDARQISKLQIENLVRAGAFDTLDANRARLFAGAETICRAAQAQAEEAASGQIGLFGGGGPEKLRLPDIPDWPDMERLGFEAEAVGFHLTAHPLDGFASLLRRLGVVPTNALQARAEAGVARVKIAGCIAGVKERSTRANTRMAWVTLSDSAGSCEVTFFSDVLTPQTRAFLTAGTPVLVGATLRLEGEALRITAQDITSLDRAAVEAGAGLRIWLRQTEAVPHIRALLTREGQGRGRISLLPMLESQEVEIALPGGFAVTPKLRQALKMVPGVERVDEV